jgi:hypothetical protein
MMGCSELSDGSIVSLPLFYRVTLISQSRDRIICVQEMYYENIQHGFGKVLISYMQNTTEDTDRLVGLGGLAKLSMAFGNRHCAMVADTHVEATMGLTRFQMGIPADNIFVRPRRQEQAPMSATAQAISRLGKRIALTTVCEVTHAVP